MLGVGPQLPLQIDIGSPDISIDRTFRLLFQMPHSNRRSALTKIGKLSRNPIFLARDWQRALENRDCSSLAALARRVGVSRARVTQVLKLLTLAPDVQRILAALGDPLPSPTVTERMLRPFVNIPEDEQRRRVHTLIDGH